MKFTFISDLHCQYPALPGGDFLIHSGDACNYGTYEEMLSFIQWFSKQQYTHKVAIAGNHCKAMEGSRSKELRDMMVGLGITYLQHEYAEIAGLKIFGSPYTPSFGYGWAFNVDRDRIDLAWQDIPKDLDVLVTHGPAYGILDMTNRGDRAGCESLLQHIIDKNPYVHAFGHIHENSGQKRIGNTLFINAACKPITLDLF